jgi:predicted GIY-YIG superfamily endonuclease
MAVYLIHLDVPLNGERHYVGYSANPRKRITEHMRARDGKSSVFMEAVKAAGIKWQVAHIWWDCGLDFEDYLHQQQREHPRYIAKHVCPLCGAQ